MSGWLLQEEVGGWYCNSRCAISILLTVHQKNKKACVAMETVSLALRYPVGGSSFCAVETARGPVLVCSGCCWTVSRERGLNLSGEHCFSKMLKEEGREGYRARVILFLRGYFKARLIDRHLKKQWNTQRVSAQKALCQTQLWSLCSRTKSKMADSASLRWQHSYRIKIYALRGRTRIRELGKGKGKENFSENCLGNSLLKKVM